MIEIYIKLSSIAIFLLIILLLSIIIPFIKLHNSKQKSLSELSKTKYDFSQNLKSTYKKNDSSYDTESENSCLAQILKKYTEINEKKIINKYKFSLFLSIDCFLEDSSVTMSVPNVSSGPGHSHPII